MWEHQWKDGFHVILNRKRHPLNSQDSEDLSSVQLSIVELSDEDSSNTLEYCRPIHIDSGPNRKDEAADALVHTVVLLNAFYHRGQSCWANGKERERVLCHLFIPFFLHLTFISKTMHDYTVHIYKTRFRMLRLADIHSFPVCMILKVSFTPCSGK